MRTSAASRPLIAVSCLLLVVLVGAAPWAQAPAQPAAAASDQVQASYTKYEYLIPMRDGVRLFTAVYAPKDASRTYPFLITRTPYSVAPYGVDQYPERLGPSEQFQKEGFIFVAQDARGRYMSEGAFQQVSRSTRRRGPRTSTRAPTPTTPSRGCWPTCRITTDGSA